MINVLKQYGLIQLKKIKIGKRRKNLDHNSTQKEDSKIYYFLKLLCLVVFVQPAPPRAAPVCKLLL